MKTWRAFFTDYRDLSTGMLYEEGQQPISKFDMAASFDVVSKSAYDEILEKNQALTEKLAGTDLEELFQKKLAGLSVAKKAELFDIIMKT